MKKIYIIKPLLFILIFIFTPVCFALDNSADPLPSWNDTVTKQHIIQFMKTVTDQTSKDFVPPADRIATFDNDGTLWVEQPLYTQNTFLIDRFKKLAEKHPEWKQRSAFKKLSRHQDISAQDLEKIFAITSSGMSIEDYIHIVKNWLASAKNSRFKRHYTELVYQPMLELIQYLQKNNFRVYIVSGSGQDFIRSFAEDIYHISPEHVIGTSTRTQYNHATIIKLPNLLLISNNAGKPEAINLFIGKKPIIAVGNSDGDKEMLEWTQSGNGKRLMMLVHHDDAKREYAYDTHSKVGTFSSALFTKAKNSRWDIISMKKDWKKIFPFDKD